ncbi:TetR/AcrR family transcriptional regulator [Brachybacterium saurashtrense]|uniref:TetR/AcrR family transcriptional regulator n=1 Tax=Brachybacterium saurashtrense TaxID=556288 RepID=A0A345YL85_9MICO|nr:TetR/AcrR family transcriptional regulator [Brachybacterium saurashtrense]AXK44687.1 TetR/AcrR family transcriptional regulator [Brachybacterium saurashtrense]RRR23299.1 TetR/AcrR family transcriptional regulator [Brachybacterium saurashtrense]
MSTSSPTRLPRAQRRAQLLELATRVFTRQGFQGTSMDDIATAAGVTKPVLYQHFDSKESLYVEVLDIIAESMILEVRAIGEHGGTTVQRVRDGLHRFYEFVALENSLRLFTGHEVISEDVQQRVVEVLDRMAIELAGVLTASRRIGTEESRVLGRGIIAITQTTAQLLQGTTEEAQRERILDTMTTAVVHGLTGFAPLENPRIAGVVLGADDAEGTTADA